MENLSRRISQLSPEKREQLLQQLISKERNNPHIYIKKYNRESTSYPLSFAQQRLWFLAQLEPGNPFYNISGSLHLQGPLQVLALQQSLNEIVHRHEALRTTFAACDGSPAQIVAPSLSLALPVIDLQGISTSDERSAVVAHLLKEESLHPFDLATGPLLRNFLLRLGQEEHFLLLSMHHIVSDIWSIGVFEQDLSTLYEAFSTNQPSPLPDLPIQYIDFALWQREWLQGERLAQHLTYWKQYFAGAPPTSTFPTDRPRPAIQTYHGSDHVFTFPLLLSQKLRRLSQREGVTLFMTLMAAFHILLYRYTTQEDIVIGSPIANRTHKEVEGLIGVFVNQLVLRSRLSGNLSFREVLAQIREGALGAYAHQDLPFERLVEELQPKRSLSYNPLFQVALALQNAPRSPLRLAHLNLRPWTVVTEVSKFDLVVFFIEEVGALTGYVEYNRDLFESATVERLVRHMQNVLESIVARPSERIAELALLTPSEQQQVLRKGSANQVTYSDTSTFIQFFEAQAARTPDAIAVVFRDTQLTYGELNRRVNQLSHYLGTLNVKPESRVGLCLERSIEAIVGILGVLKAGGSYVPLDPTYPRQRLTFMIEDAQVALLITQQSLLTQFSFYKGQIFCLETQQRAIDEESGENTVPIAQAHHLAYIIYTSGSTGKPKAVLIEHHGLCNLAQAQSRAFNIHLQSRVLQFASLSFDASVSEIFMTLLSGAVLHLEASDDLLPDNHLITLLQARGITAITIPPSVLTVLPPETIGLPEIIISAGEACSVDVAARWSIGRRFFNAYGPTEATVCATIDEYVKDSERITIGRPITNTQVYLLDKYLQLVPIGVPGEIYIGGNGLARGYLNHPEKTAEHFVPHPFSTTNGERLYKTGDMARFLPDGRIEFLGRIDNQVKLRGFRIELGEIETILDQHPEVQEGVVAFMQEELVGYIVRKYHYDASNASEQFTQQLVPELRRFLKERLPEYMIPTAFVLLTALPRNVNGKIDRPGLPVPSSNRPDLEAVYIIPQTVIERKIAVIWQEVLDLEQIGIYDNFFELGGHSLLATQVVARVSESLQIELRLQSLFEAPTIIELAKTVESLQSQSPNIHQQLQVLYEIEQLSEEEIDKLIEQELQTGNSKER